jgi:hypothetical protein
MDAGRLIGAVEADDLNQMGSPALPSTVSQLANMMPGSVAISLPEKSPPDLSKLLGTFDK